MKPRLRAMLLITGVFAFGLALGQERPTPQSGWVATFSIVAFDPRTGELGVAVQSKFPAVGAVVPYAKAGVGAVATQALANTRYGPEGLLRLSKGEDPKAVVKALVTADPLGSRRQLGIVNAQGIAANFTGRRCFSYAGGLAGKNYSVQGNLLASEAVLKDMASTFEKTPGLLAERMIAALEAGQAAGGDRRGRQSAALLIVRKGWGFQGQNDRFRDLRVDDHAKPIAELRRVYKIHRRLFRHPMPAPKATSKPASQPKKE